MTTAEVLEKARELPRGELNELIRELFILSDEVEAADEAAIHEEWVEVATSRADDLLEGWVKGIPGEEVHHRTQEIINSYRS